MAKIEFTRRETQVLKLVCSDKMNQEIAAKLGLNIRTIEKIKTALFRKTKTGSVLSLFKWALKQKLVKV